LKSESTTPLADKALEPRAHPGRAIVTYGRSLMALVIARSLHEHGVEVIGCDDLDMTVLSFSRHVKDSFTHTAFQEDEEQALSDFEEAVRRFAPEDGRPYVLIPSFRDARIFARHRDRFEPLIAVAAPDWSSIGMVDPKDQFARFLEEHELPGPKTQIIAPHRNRKRLPAKIQYPVVAKPVDGVGGRGVEIMRARRDLRRYLSQADPSATVLLQELIEGEDFCVSFVAERGTLVGVVAYRNLTQFPRKAGAGAVRETVDAAPFLTATRALVKATKWNGVAEIDFRWSGRAHDQPKMIEVNPRYWAGLYHSMASGIDFPWIAYRLAAGLSVEALSDEPVEVGKRTRTPGVWILSAAQDIAESDPHLAEAAKAWEKCKANVSRGHLIAALKRLSQSAIHTARGVPAAAALHEQLKEYADLSSELSSDDDPAVSLGVLFALSSLIRYGELPPELKYTPDEKEPPAKSEPPEAPAPPVKRRPVIGVTKPDDGDWLAYQAMRFAIRVAGGRAVKLTTRAPRDPRSIDGLLFGGGADVFPERYQGKPKKGYRYDVARDDMEASWAQAAFEHDIPVLGVCRGMQMLNVLGGGTLLPDLTRFEGRRAATSLLHNIFYRVPIAIEEGSALAEATGATQLRVNAIHTQAVDKLGEAFSVAAREPNGLVQAIEHTGNSFAIGVQFHPEFLIYRRFARRLFRRFVDAAREHVHRRAAPDTREEDTGTGRVRTR